jgi:hypothetical protein
MAENTKLLDMTPLFPQDLLQKSKGERLKFFRRKIIGHPYINSVRDEVLWAIEDSAPGSIIICCGPPGVGKTTVLKDIEVALIKKRQKELEQDPGILAVATIHLKSPQTGNFDWKKHYFKPLLVSMEEPLVDKKIDMSPWAPHHRENMRLIASKKADGDAYRDVVESALRNRNPTAVLVDDAHHAGVISSGRKLLDQTNTFKSLADQTGITHVLVATYEIVPFRNLNGQLSRRSIDVHFSRYRAWVKTELNNVINALYTFQRWLPLEIMPDFVRADGTCPDWDYFYERSLGCIGILKDWISRAYSLALRQGAKTLTLDHLNKRALSISALTKLLAEITLGEKELEESAEERRLLRANLGLTVSRRQAPGTQAQQAQPEEKTSSEGASKGGRKNRAPRPGKRAPKRDKVGRRAA